MSFVEPCASVREIAGQHYCAERGEAQEDKTEDGVDEAEEVWALATWASLEDSMAQRSEAKVDHSLNLSE